MQIRIAQKDDAEVLAEIIRRANAPVAGKFGIIAEHHELRHWYEQRGVTLTETKRYPHRPFTVAFMRLRIR